MQELDVSEFIASHRLPESYSHNVQDWFIPLAQDIVLQCSEAEKPVVVGINGAQGSGKTTLAALLVFIFERQHQLHAVSISLDDFYLPRRERKALAEKSHPLLAVRGVPGTHDIALAKQVLTSLAGKQKSTSIPRFNKADDNRVSPNKWDVITKPVDIIVFEGWCLGAEPQSEEELSNPVNTLEAEQDQNIAWRKYVNQQLQNVYPDLFDYIDTWIMLKAPSFDCVYNWRLEQENKLRALSTDKKKMMDEDSLSLFIQHYQRITENTLKTLPDKVDYLFELDEQREIINTFYKTDL